MILQWAARLAHHTLDARQVVVTPDDRGPQINIVAWTCMVVMVLSVATRLAIKYNAFRSFGWDDGLVAAAMVRRDFAVCSRKDEDEMLRRLSTRSSQSVKQSPFLCRSATVDLVREYPHSQAVKFDRLKRASMLGTCYIWWHFIPRRCPVLPTSYISPQTHVTIDGARHFRSLCPRG